MEIGALITAAGAGSRLGEPKQFLDLTPSERLVDRAVATVGTVAEWVGVILPAGREWDGPSVDATCAGGGSRHASLKAGLAIVPPSIDVIVIHSASHPLASAELVRHVVATVAGGADGAVPFLDAVDTVKRRNDDGALRSVGREGLGSAQCPMAYSRAVLDDAFARVEHGIEESELVEAIGGRVVAVPGEIWNIHVVDRPSLAVARCLATAGGIFS